MLAAVCVWFWSSETLNVTVLLRRKPGSDQQASLIPGPVCEGVCLFLYIHGPKCSTGRPEANKANLQWVSCWNINLFNK